MTLGVVILARMSSKRLPEKMLRPVAGRPLIDHVIDRARRIPSVPHPIVATSDHPGDDRLAAHCHARGVGVFRGPLDNAARRVRDCAVDHGWDYFARINGDSPFLDPHLIERGLNRAVAEQLDFVTNLQPRTYPYGIAVEVFSTEAYRRAFHRMNGPEDHEHVSAYFYRNLTEFRYVNIASPNGPDTDVRLTVDSEADLARVEDVIRRLGHAHRRAPLDRILAAYRASVGGNVAMAATAGCGTAGCGTEGTASW